MRARRMHLADSAAVGPTRGTRRVFGRSRVLLVGLAGVGVLAGTGVSAALASASATVRASAAHATSAKSNKPDVAYFAGKTITWITNEVGASNDEFTRALLPSMAAYLHCNIVIENIANTIAQENDAAAAAPNGLTLATNQINQVLDDDVSGVYGIDFSLQKQAILGAVPTNDGILAVAPNYPIQSFKQLVAAKTVTSFVDETPGGTDLEFRLMLGAYHVKARLVLGYTSNGAVTAGFLRGDAPGIINGYTTLEQPILAGLAHVIMQSNPLAPGESGYAFMKKIPSVASFDKQDPPKTALGKAAIKELLSIVQGPNMTVTAPEGTPAPIAAALADAFHFAMEQPSVIHQLSVVLADNPHYISAAQAKADIVYDFKHQNVIEQMLTLGV